MGNKVPLIENDSLQATPAGYQLGVRLAWYRSLPLACLEKLELKLDGQPVPAEALRVHAGGRAFTLSELEDQVETYWFVQDALTVSVQQPGRVQPGTAHTLAVEYAMRYPYILIGPGRFLTGINRYTTTQVAR